MKKCYNCGHPLDVGDRVGFRDTCDKCGEPLHCCLNCLFYSPGSYNDCKEPSAERVIHKDQANFCEYFKFREE